MITAGTVLAGGAVMLTRCAIEEQASRRILNQAKAFQLSEAGLDLTIHSLRTNPAYTGTTYADLGNGIGGYSIAITPDAPSRRVLRVTGFYPSNDPAAFGYTARTIEAVVEIAEVPGPGYGVLGEEGVRFDGFGDEGAKLDSYDSRRGPYSPQGSRANVRLCTNQKKEKAIALTGGVTIKADVILGPGSDPETTLWQTPRDWTAISGSVTIAETKAPVEPIAMPMLPGGGRLRIAGHDVVTLPGGLYRFRDIHISGNGQLIFTGPAQVYVEEEVRIAGNGIRTASQLPTDLTFYINGSHVSISGQTDLFAKVSAPHATVDISGRGDVYGAVSGREIVVRGGARIHYDEALNLYDVALSPPRGNDPLHVRTLSWREVDP